MDVEFPQRVEVGLNSLPCEADGIGTHSDMPQLFAIVVITSLLRAVRIQPAVALKREPVSLSCA